MTKLKFRIWDKVDKRFIYPNDVRAKHFTVTLDGKVYNSESGFLGDDWDDYEVNSYVGADIYEGDIVRIECGRTVVRGTVQYDYLNSAFLVNGTCAIFGPEQHIEIIGNIYE